MLKSKYPIGSASGFQGVIFVKAEFHSSNGFHSIETGNSAYGFITNQSYKRMLKRAIWNAAYAHVFHGGNYEWNYKLVYAYVNYNMPKGVKIRAVRKRKHEEPTVMVVKDDKVVSRYRRKDHYAQNVRKEIIKEQKASSRYITKKEYKTMFAKKESISRKEYDRLVMNYEKQLRKRFLIRH